MKLTKGSLVSLVAAMAFSDSDMIAKTSANVRQSIVDQDLDPVEGALLLALTGQSKKSIDGFISGYPNRINALLSEIATGDYESFGFDSDSPVTRSTREALLSAVISALHASVTEQNQKLTAFLTEFPSPSHIPVEAIIGPESLGKVGNLSASESSGNITLSWDSVTGANTYSVFASFKKNGFFPSLFYVGSSESNSLDLTDILGAVYNTEIRFAVRASFSAIFNSVEGELSDNLDYVAPSAP